MLGGHGHGISGCLDLFFLSPRLFVLFSTRPLAWLKNGSCVWFHGSGHGTGCLEQKISPSDTASLGLLRDGWGYFRISWAKNMRSEERFSKLSLSCCAAWGICRFLKARKDSITYCHIFSTRHWIILYDSWDKIPFQSECRVSLPSAKHFKKG